MTHGIVIFDNLDIMLSKNIYSLNHLKGRASKNKTKESRQVREMIPINSLNDPN